MDSEPKVGRSKGSDKSKRTYEKYGKNTSKGVRIKEQAIEKITEKTKSGKKKK